MKLVIKHTPIDTKWSGLLYQNQGMVSKVTVELFIDVFHYNTYAGEMMVAAERMMVKLLLR